MKDIRYTISLYISIPVIFAGIVLLSCVVSYNIAVYYLNSGIDPFWPFAFWGSMLIIFTLISSLLIVRLLVKPLEQFAVKTEKLGIEKNISDDKFKVKKRDEMSRFTYIFEQVTELLSRVEVRELFPQIVGQSKAMRSVLSQIIKVAPTNSTVLILGKTGTGKELVARSISEHSLQKDKPFVAINCAAIPEGLLESELFGHEKGAFTGANARKLGKIEIANNGTIFLDEIGDMPLGVQAKILRVLQESQIERVGGISPIEVKVRFIAATNKDLSKMVEAGEFREDLFFRLNVFSIHLPPLRERKEDIPLLVNKFIKQFDRDLDISSESMLLLTAYDWPGNVRELQNIMESASVMAEDVIEPVHLPSKLIHKLYGNTDETEKTDFPESLNYRLRELEKGMIIEALVRAGGVQTRAAKLLGIKERSLWHRVKKLNIDAVSLKGNVT